MRSDNSIHLKNAAQKRHETTRIKAIAALHDLDQTGAPITFVAVAEHAGVSRSWLYTQTDLKDEIRRIAALREPRLATPSSRKEPASEASLRNRLSLAHQRIHELDNENHRLRDQIAHLHGQLRTARLAPSKTPSTTQTP
ncbi:transposase [Mycolicibacterium cyprinidarum]|nr:transposase [Mycolicibacterium sp. NGTWS1803]